MNSTTMNKKNGSKLRINEDIPLFIGKVVLLQLFL